MPFPQPKNEPRPPPLCKLCREPMVRERGVPLSYAPTFETVYYRCAECGTRAVHDAVPRPDEQDSDDDAQPQDRTRTHNKRST